MGGVLFQQSPEERFRFDVFLLLQVAFRRHVSDIHNQIAGGVGGKELGGVLTGRRVVAFSQRSETGHVKCLWGGGVRRVLLNKGRVQGHRLGPLVGYFISGVGLIHQQLRQERTRCRLGKCPADRGQRLGRLVLFKQCSGRPVSGLGQGGPADLHNAAEQFLRGRIITGQIIAFPPGKVGRANQRRLGKLGRQRSVQCGRFGIFLKLRERGGLANGGMVGHCEPGRGGGRGKTGGRLGVLTPGEQRFGLAHADFDGQRVLGKFRQESVVSFAGRGVLAQFLSGNAQGVQCVGRKRAFGKLGDKLVVHRGGFLFLVARVQTFTPVEDCLSKIFAAGIVGNKFLESVGGRVVHFRLARLSQGVLRYSQIKRGLFQDLRFGVLGDDRLERLQGIFELVRLEITDTAVMICPINAGVGGKVGYERRPLPGRQIINALVL